MSDGEGPSTPRRLAIGVLLLLMVAAGFHLLARRTPSPAREKPKAPTAAALESPRVKVESAFATKSVQTDAKPSGATREFCGLANLTVDSGDPLAPYRYIEAATHQAAEAWLSALRNSDDTRARAVGLILTGRIDRQDLTWAPMQEQNRDELVALAVGAGDPGVYAMALEACGAYSTPQGGTCQQLSVSAWARLDPDNAMPWMLMAGKAQARNDTAAATQYFERAAEAKKIDSYYESLFAWSESELPNDVSALGRWYLTTQSLGVAATLVPPFAPAMRYCSGTALEDDQIRERCATVAELMVSSGTTVLEYAMGVSLGARTGWSPARVSELTEQLDAWMQVSMLDEETETGMEWSCAAVEQNNAQMRRRVQAGELRALREEVENSGKTVSELAQEQRAWRERTRLKTKNEN